MRDSWLVAMRQGCRISETACSLSRIDRKQGTISFIAKEKNSTAPLHDYLRELVAKAFKERRATLVELPIYAPKKSSQFLKGIGLPHLSFHCTRVTVITKFYVGHASDTVHAIYQRLWPNDVRPFARCCPVLLSKLRVLLQPIKSPQTVETPPGIRNPGYFVRLMNTGERPSFLGQLLDV